MELVRVHCSDLWELKLQDDCCGSCHDEWDEGYGEAIEYLIVKFGKQIQFFVCCIGFKLAEEFEDDDLKKILEFKQKEKV